MTHGHRVLSKALADAVRHELLVRNPVAMVSPPKVPTTEMQILTADQVQTVLAALRQTSIYPQIVVLLSTGMRRGELAGLQWRDLDLDAGKLRIERTVEKTKMHGLRLKEPKTKRGRRAITLPASAVEVLRTARRSSSFASRLALASSRRTPSCSAMSKARFAIRIASRKTGSASRPHAAYRASDCIRCATAMPQA